MNRRRFLTSIGAGCAFAANGLPAFGKVGRGLAASIPADHPLQAAWQAWKGLCLMPEGRVVDALQNADSHSEGQGYGLCLAAAFDDLAAFELIFQWSEENLALRPDALLAWRWRHDQMPRVPDRNNASDGDLFYAWALSAMAVRHDRPDWGRRARLIATDLASVCIVAHPDGSGRKLFLPGAKGFEIAGGYVINPSYYMPRAMEELAAASSVDALSRAAEDGRALMAAIAETELVPDWIMVDAAGWQPAPQGFSVNAGYESLRVPLFAAWSADPQFPPARRYVAALDAAPGAGAVTVFDPQSGAPLERSPHPGYRALSALVSCAQSGSAAAAIPAFSIDQPYYPATLHLMALVAQAENYPQCVPL
ncbi:glycosyl hydrolase family 8 [Phaeovulum sp. W22_SRMD_FR3]|uniref:glycosyl hydrolase family 8 n=1 Tax=Phaeovulum sp. W22_SRMD_FR3 TaxID=3240274 RepID=UPI003F97ABFA